MDSRRTRHPREGAAALRVHALLLELEQALNEDDTETIARVREQLDAARGPRSGYETRG